jgi:hypothetical protein
VGVSLLTGSISLIVQVSLFLKLKNTGKFATSSQNCMEVFVLKVQSPVSYVGILDIFVWSIPGNSSLP